MDSLYSNELRQYIRSQPWPSGLVYEIVEYDEHLQFRLFRENINALTGEAKIHLASLLNTVLMKIQGEGIPIYTEVAKGKDWNGA